MGENCPMCGAAQMPASDQFECGTFDLGGPEEIEGQQCLHNQLAAKDARIAELEEMVDRLPKTADGAPLIPGMRLWQFFQYGAGISFILDISAAHGWSRGGDGGLWVHDEEGCNSGRIESCYSTLEAAEAAQSATEELK